MEELTLEKEFQFFKLQHMYDILFIRITNYYRDLQTTGVCLPQFMVEKPEDLAKKELSNILADNNREYFYNLYEKAYQELAVVGEI